MIQRMRVCAALLAVLTPLAAQELRVYARYRLTGAAVEAVAFRADGRKLASLGELGDVIVRDVATGEVEHRFDAARPRSFARLAFRPDGGQVAVLTETLVVWDLATEKPLADLGKATRCRWSADSKRLAYARGGGDGVRIADATTLAREHDIPHRDGVVAIDWSPDGCRLAVAWHTAVEVRDTASWKRLSLEEGGSLRNARYRPDGELVVIRDKWIQHGRGLWTAPGLGAITSVADRAGYGLVWKAGELTLHDAAGKRLRKLTAPDGERFSDSAVASDGKTVATMTLEGEGRLWRASGSRPLGGHRARVRSLAFPENDYRLAAAGGGVLLADLREDGARQRIQRTGVVTGGAGYRVHFLRGNAGAIWDLSDVAKRETLARYTLGPPRLGQSPVAAVLAPGGKHVAFADWQGKRYVKEIAGGEPAVQLTQSLSVVVAPERSIDGVLCWNHDGTRILSVWNLWNSFGTCDAILELYDTSGKKLRGREDLTGVSRSCAGAAFDPSGGRLLVGGSLGGGGGPRVGVRDPDELTLRKDLEIPAPWLQFAEGVLATHDGKELTLREPKDLEPIVSHAWPAGIHCAAISRHGRFVAIAHDDEIRVLEHVGR